MAKCRPKPVSVPLTWKEVGDMRAFAVLRRTKAQENQQKDRNTPTQVGHTAQAGYLYQDMMAILAEYAVSKYTGKPMLKVSFTDHATKKDKFGPDLEGNIQVKYVYYKHYRLSVCKEYDPAMRCVLVSGIIEGDAPSLQIYGYIPAGEAQSREDLWDGGDEEYNGIVVAFNAYMVDPWLLYPAQGLLENLPPEKLKLT